MKRRPPDRDDPDRIHREMLEHLEQNPPPKTKPKSETPHPAPSSTTRGRAPGPTSPPPERPELMLRRLHYEEAMFRLARFLEFHAGRGTPEVRIVHGKGLRSGEEGPVLKDAVRRYCDEHPRWVRSHHSAPRAEGGDGALIVVLKTTSEGQN